MAKSPHNAEWKLRIVEEYLSGQGSYESLAKTYGIGETTLKDWIRKYREQGAVCFVKGEGNAHYNKEFKTMCVEAVLRGDGYVDDIVAKFNISNRSVLWQWIKRYNANKELKDYAPNREVYMAYARRKTTLEERREITEYCISHGKDYKGTAALYDVSYSQVYTWVKKYLETGEDGLTDKRGKHKTDDEVGELERLRRENFRLKRQLEERDMVVELLKKVKEFEGM
ncbi:transposase [Desulfitobacterium dichloroeliminans LMG P-21439]|uniref:Transposase n=1 Tax=Desulfitobacterium dichloroeliminans (strain LMG P-21439 / DCA1) TaxID=871963 RepID=L0F4D0_DESDL|nr:helix-turn-helix domain-containing protein [Desulfitobacterium dichloroeliminans]AGA68012.1 transposase [Desulfitobacterium dichloroeliminans LMG P-21439]